MNEFDLKKGQRMVILDEGEYSDFLEYMKSKTDSAIVSNSVITPNQYILLDESIGSLISINKFHHNNTWHKMHELLQKEDSFMPNPNDFRSLLLLLSERKARYADGSKIKEEEQIRIYNEITEVRSPLRAEYLDARFEKRKDELYLLSDHIVQSNNSLVPSAQEILHPETLMKDRVPGISLEDYIRNLTPQGLPRNDVKKGDLYYWYPKNECVVMFNADSGRSWLSCDRNPQYSYSSLGVRRKIFHRK